MKTLITVVRWILAIFITLLGIAMFGMDNPISGVFIILLAIAISPISTKLLSKYNICLKKSVIISVLCALFLASCGSCLALTDTSDSSGKKDVAEDNQEVSSDDISDNNADDIAPSDEIGELPEVLPEELTEQSPDQNPEEPEPNKMKVHFIDVGQGDSTLIECRDEYMLIDAGPDSVGTRLQKYLSDNNVTKLKYLVLTHPDSDHIGGADVIVSKFDIEKIMMSSYIGDSDDYMHLIEALGNREYGWVIPGSGDTLSLGDAEITIIQSKEYADSNNSSLCLRIDYDENSFIFTGDSEEESENDMVMSGADIEADVYQVGHHGSYTSSSRQFLDKVKPQYAVISCGTENEYSHPHQETIDNLREINTSMFRTDIQGTIIATTDGKDIEWSIDPSTKLEGGSSEYEREYRNSLKQPVPENPDNGIIDASEAGAAAIVGGATAAALSDSIGVQNELSTNTGIVESTNRNDLGDFAYIGNINNMKLHRASCTGKLPKESNRVYFHTLEEAEAAGYTKENQCKNCTPYY